jgi:TRAP-type C4-dicarboxylate transport system substrate-binding protein
MMSEKKKISRRAFLKGTAAAAGVGGATLAFRRTAKAATQKTWKLKLQSNWTGIGITSQDEAAKLFCERVNKLSGGRIEMKNFDAEVLLGIGETFKGVASGVADVAVTSPIYHRGIVPVAYYLWAVPFFPNDHLEFMELWYQVLGGKEIWREAYAKHGVMALTYECSDEWGTMVSTKPIRKFSDYKGMKVRAFGIWADWLVHNGASIVTVPGGEIYMAIQTKIVDAAAFGSPDAWYGAKLYEVCKYFINPSIIPYDTCEVIMNLKTFNEMPPDLQEVMLSASRIHNLDLSARTVQTDAKARKGLKEKGMETIFIPSDELRKAEEWCWNKFLQAKGKDPYIDRLIEVYTKAREIHKAYYGPKQLPID